MDLQESLTSAPAPASFIKDTDELRFEQDVLNASMTRPVIVDFWATWCAPCKVMMPLLEKAVRDAAGAVAMVKVDIDKNPGLGQALRIQSVPTVYAFYQGKPVDGFAGAKPESVIRTFVEKLVKLSADKNPEAAAEGLTAEQIKKIMSEGDLCFQRGAYDEAMAKYGAILDLDQNNMEALGGIGWCLLSQGDGDSVREMLAQLSPEQLHSSRLQGLQFILSLKETVSGLRSVAELGEILSKNPKDLQALQDLSLQNLAAGHFEAGIDVLISSIHLNREWQEQKARKLLIEVFEALGPTHPLTLPGRRKLSSVLFS